MRMYFLALVCGALLGGGCSKKTSTSAGDSGDGVKGEAAAVQQPSPIVAASLEDVSKKIESREYEKAVGSLMELKEFPKSPEEQAQFQSQVQQTWNGLSQKAAAGDPQAREAAQMLGRVMTGR
jgi:hypothetical protein